MQQVFRSIYLWQTVLSPHVFGLAVSLGSAGHKVTYVAQKDMSVRRLEQGWKIPEIKDIQGVQVLLAPNPRVVTEIVQSAPQDSIHICQGLRGNGLIGYAQTQLARRDLQTWVLLEALGDSGLLGIIRRGLYRWLLWYQRRQFAGILAIGWRTKEWIIGRGVDQERVFEFAYFLPVQSKHPIQPHLHRSCFRFVFVGQLIERKQVGLLINALASVDGDFELLVIGDGPCRRDWEGLAEEKIPGRVRWLGQLPMSEIPSRISNSDCLVLPSRHDGWGAVVSEALMVGTPVICSDACGAAGVVHASGIGGVFEAGDLAALTAQLKQMLKRGVLTANERRSLSTWAEALGASSGARYLSEILTYGEGYSERPQAPWIETARASD